ncbi:MAG: hypothetical protein ACI8W8_000725 [Rhodothermales bacterium]|jgi:hypothetical protein
MNRYDRSRWAIVKPQRCMPADRAHIVSMEPIRVHVCLGLTCGPLGNNSLISMLHAMPEAEKKHLEIITHNCYARCALEEAVCPCVRYNDEDWLVQADAKAVRRELRKRVAERPSTADPDDPFAAYFE